MDQFMKRSVQLSAAHVREGGEPIGSVRVKVGDVIAEGVNELHKQYDISGHAELVAIRKAQEKLQTHDLSGYTMYASGAPCPMCYTPMYYSGIKDVYYCATIQDTADAGLGASSVLYEDFKKPEEERIIEMQHMPLEQRSEERRVGKACRSWRRTGAYKTQRD